MTARPPAGPGPRADGCGDGEALHARLARLRAARGQVAPDFTDRVRELVVIASSSRGGSSMLAELLRSSSAFFHLRAELGPFLRLVGLAHPASGAGSDRLDAAHAHEMGDERRAILADDLAHDAGSPSAEIDDDERFGFDVAWRLLVQWPNLDLDSLALVSLARGVLGSVRSREGWGSTELRDPWQFQARLVQELRERGFPVSLRRYDLPGDAEPDGAVAPSTPAGDVVEEPPFVLPRPWRPVAGTEVADKPLVIKTPSNAYRLSFLRALFPSAQVRVIHLTRNPAAAINGLLDGWRYPGFHAHRMSRALRIAGYGDDAPADRRWWKFDLPPGWRDYTDAPLPQVCAFQWRAAHQAILAGIEEEGLDHRTLRFEDLLDGPGRVATLSDLCGWLGAPFDAALERVAQRGIGPVMATVPPGGGRWRARYDDVLSAIDPPTRLLAERLGYVDELAWA